ncbi:FecR domain-containing protein [Parapedobacter defluvii]|uniref:FecR family protein n=1 Tax=Parapedobacter defluvii TaxID=2045106 RepID=UPI00333E29C9
MDKDQASALLDKYRRGECTPEEERMLFDAFNRVSLPDRAPLSAKAYEHWEAVGLESIHRKIARKERRILHQWRSLVAAAALLAVLSVAYLFLSTPTDTGKYIKASDVLPGGNRATLSVVGGPSLQLDSNQTNIVIDGQHIAYADNTPIEGLSLGKDNFDDDLLLLALTTPKGGTYQITLSDGTQVWLNAASTLQYPSRFDGKERRVEISGEAFFSVAKDPKRPFRVISNGQEIEVLGTEFNVSAYPDEDVTKTTLLTGSVRLCVGTTGTNISLIPGEQAVSKAGSITKQEVDTGPIVAWKEGYFKLNGSLQSIMAQIGRWYDVEVVFERNVDASMELVGEISRDVKLSDILRMINEIDGGLKFSVKEISGRRGGESVNQQKRRLTIMR